VGSKIVLRGLRQTGSNLFLWLGPPGSSHNPGAENWLNKGSTPVLILSVFFCFPVFVCLFFLFPSQVGVFNLFNGCSCLDMEKKMQLFFVVFFPTPENVFSSVQ
jgi:hypothetical protein